MKALLRTQQYWQMCQHEFFRPSNPNIITDVYDGSEWKQFMGAAQYPNRRLRRWYPCFCSRHPVVEAVDVDKSFFASRIAIEAQVHPPLDVNAGKHKTTGTEKIF